MLATYVLKEKRTDQTDKVFRDKHSSLHGFDELGLYATQNWQTTTISTWLLHIDPVGFRFRPTDKGIISLPYPNSPKISTVLLSSPCFPTNAYCQILWIINSEIWSKWLWRKCKMLSIFYPHPMHLVSKNILSIKGKNIQISRSKPTNIYV
jgi:hypothetical protein